jgi:RNA recognition motif-containing protein
MKYKRYGDENEQANIGNSNNRFRTSSRTRQALGPANPLQENGSNDNKNYGKPRVITQDVIAKSIFLGNVPCSVSPYDLKKIFRQYGGCKDESPKRWKLTRRR